MNRRNLWPREKWLGIFIQQALPIGEKAFHSIWSLQCICLQLSNRNLGQIQRGRSKEEDEAYNEVARTSSPSALKDKFAQHYDEAYHVVVSDQALDVVHE